MAMSNHAEQYQHQISDIFDKFLNSMRDSRVRVDIDSLCQDGFCIVKLTLWRCRSCQEDSYLFRTLFYVHRQYDLTNLQRHLDAIVWTYSVSPRSDSSETEADADANADSEGTIESNWTIYSESDTQHIVLNSDHPASTSDEYNWWTPTKSEADSDCRIIDPEDYSDN